jgi:hypothetical protein
MMLTIVLREVIQVDALRQGAELLGSNGGVLGKIVQYLTYFAIISTAIGVFWKLFVNKMPPGQAGPWSSWNRIMLTKTCNNADCEQHHTCSHKKHRFAWQGIRTRVSLRKKCRLAECKPKPCSHRKHRFARRGIIIKISLRKKCRLPLCNRKPGPCVDRKAKIAWEGVTLKLPWRKAHPTHLWIENDSIDPVTYEETDGQKKQRALQAVFGWKVKADRKSDDPYLASDIFVRDRSRNVIQKVSVAARLAQAKYDIAGMKDPATEYLYVNELCEKELADIGVVLISFGVSEAPLTPQQVLQDGMIEAARISNSGQSDTKSSNGYHGVQAALSAIVANEGLDS